MTEENSLIGRVTRATGEVAGNAVVSATRERAQKAGRVAKGQLPATREDLMRMAEQLDRIEASLSALTKQVEAAKPRKRAAAASAGDAKTES
jgi:hypothetical protein